VPLTLLPALPVAIAVTIAVFLFMLAETQLSRFNERHLRAKGAIEPPDDVYPLMRLAYPASFVAMGIEGALHQALNRDLVLAGLILLGWAKALKFWAIGTLGTRWSFRVLVLPGAPLVATGPYRFLRHPNYVGVLGELVAIAVTLAAPISGTIAVVMFAWILRRRIKVEERALGLSAE
jgi:methyltransferase